MESDTRNFLLWSVKVKQEKELLICVCWMKEILLQISRTRSLHGLFSSLWWTIFTWKRRSSLSLCNSKCIPEADSLKSVGDVTTGHRNRFSNMTLEMAASCIRKQRGEKTPYFCSGWDGWGRNSRTWPFWLHSCNREAAGTAAVPRMNFHLILSSSWLSADQDILPDPRV